MTALTRPADGVLSPVRDDRPIDVDLIKRTVAKGATDDELALYLHDCQRRGVHPLDRLLHFTIRTEGKERRYTPIVSIDLFRSRAASTGQYAGSDDPVNVVEPGTTYPQQSTVTVYRLVGGIRCPFTATARWFEYKPATSDFMWKKMPFTMLGKCAEALALRKAFPAELGGLYTEDEMEQAGPAADPHMTVEANRLSPEEQAAARAANPQPPAEPHVGKGDIDKLKELAGSIGLSPAGWMRAHATVPVKRIGNLKMCDVDKFVLGLHRERVAELLPELELTLDEVRIEDSSVVGAKADELDLDQCKAALDVLIAAKERQAVPA